MRRIVGGDIHGAHRALVQVLQRAHFNPKEDLFISLGDTADGWPDVVECFEELFRMKNLIYILGNHDSWFLDWLSLGKKEIMWVYQGGQATLDSYINRIKTGDTSIHKKTQDLLEEAYSHYITNDNKLFVHGGFNWKKPINLQDTEFLMWDRQLFKIACMWQDQATKNNPLHLVKDYDEVFIGHTTTSFTHSNLLPVHVSNIWNLDQGAGWEGKLTLMDIDTKEFWQSDLVKTLYPEVKGR